MHPSQRPATVQRQRVGHYVNNADSYAMFNLLTGPQLPDPVETQLPKHQELLFPRTETLSMFPAQVLSADGSCQQPVNDAMVSRAPANLTLGTHEKYPQWLVWSERRD
jgi:hypothetical protein